MPTAKSVGSRLFVAGLLCVATACIASAQDFVALPSSAVEPPLIAQADIPAESSIEEPPLPSSDSTAAPIVEAPTNNAANAVSDTPRRLKYELRFAMRGVYDDNINISSTNKIHDFYMAFEPGFSLGFGDLTEKQENFIGVDYGTTIQRYIDHSEADSEQHAIKIMGQYRASRLTMTLGQDIQVLNNASIIANSATDVLNRDVASRTSVRTYTTRLGASYYVSGKTFLSSDLGSAITDYDSLISSSVYFGDFFVNYDYSPKLTIGIGGGAGYNSVDSATPDQTFQQIRGRFSYHASGKVSFNASVGAEFRQFEGDMRGTYVSPVFDLGATYQPFDGTSIDLVAGRQTLNSASIAGQDFASTTLSVTARQRLLRRFQLGLMLGYENADYFSATSTSVASERSDNYYSVQPSIDVTMTRFWSLGVYYLHRTSESSFENFTFHDNQVGLRTAIKF